LLRSMLNLLSVIIPPLLAIYFAVTFRSKLNSRDSTILIGAFLISFLTVIFGFMVKYVAGQLGFKPETGDYSAVSNVLFTNLTYSFFSGFVDEFCKYLVIVAYAYRRKEFDEPLAGIFVTIMIAMGFTTMENIIHIFMQDNYVDSWRMLINIPVSICLAIVMGYFAGMSKYGLDSDDLSSMGLRMRSLFLASLFHAFYTFFLFLNDYKSVMTLMIIAGLILLIQVGLNIFRARRLHVRLMYSRSRRSKQAYDNPFSS
jgi:RsiW-degrading membrane proteinase PrsW (M82 family)